MEKKKQVLKVVEKLASIKVKRESECGIPICLGILHQPKRPEKK